MYNILNHIMSSKLYCSLITIMGLAVRYYIGKRRFYRRGAGGLQHYSNYWVAIVSTIIEWIGQLIAYILIKSGTALLLAWFYKNG